MYANEEVTLWTVIVHTVQTDTSDVQNKQTRSHTEWFSVIISDS